LAGSAKGRSSIITWTNHQNMKKASVNSLPTAWQLKTNLRIKTVQKFIS